MEAFSERSHTTLDFLPKVKPKQGQPIRCPRFLNKRINQLACLFAPLLAVPVAFLAEALKPIASSFAEVVAFCASSCFPRSSPSSLPSMSPTDRPLPPFISDSTGCKPKEVAQGPRISESPSLPSPVDPLKYSSTMPAVGFSRPTENGDFSKLSKASLKCLHVGDLTRH